MITEFPKIKDGTLIAVWFSCGAASAVAAKLIHKCFSHRCDVRIINNPIKQEDADNRRFLKDVEKWIGVKIEDATNPKYPTGDCVQVWTDRKFMSGPEGAPCTVHLKKKARQIWEDLFLAEGDITVMGFTSDEAARSDRFRKTERESMYPILIEAGLTKEDCFQIISDAGIELPYAYRAGMPNANCIGCVKATSPTYWNHVRRVFPEAFAQRAMLSREIGAKLVRVKNERIYLDELDPDAKGRPMKRLKMPDCGIFCEEKPVRS
jgi:3'-phosphoadenosine 5'-phosphosulfate sulfotransferase (PAPS reductase)/FAD synthetase